MKPLPLLTGRFAEVLFSRDAEMVRKIINDEWAVDVGEYVIHQWMAKLSPVMPLGGWSDSTVLCWLRMRLLESGPSVFKADEDWPRMTTRLHTFPINYWQSEEEKLRLSGGETMPQDATPKPARSKLTRMLSERVKPVDGLAAKVSPGDWVNEGDCRE